MQITRFAKTVVYLIATALLTAVSFWIQSGLLSAATRQNAYGRSVIFLFVAAISLLGVGVYSYRHHTLKKAARRPSCGFCFCAGNGNYLSDSQHCTVRFL